MSDDKVRKVGFTVYLYPREKADFKAACDANDTDMSKYLSKQAKAFTAKCNK